MNGSGLRLSHLWLWATQSALLAAPASLTDLVLYNQEHPQLAQVVQLCGGSVVTDPSKSATLICLDEQAVAGVSAPVGSHELHITTAGRVLVSADSLCTANVLISNLT